MRFLDWWRTLSARIRYPVALLVLAGATLGFVLHPAGLFRLWGLGWALGVILLIIGPTSANRRGYHF